MGATFTAYSDECITNLIIGIDSDISVLKAATIAYAILQLFHSCTCSFCTFQQLIKPSWCIFDSRYLFMQLNGCLMTNIPVSESFIVIVVLERMPMI